MKFQLHSDMRLWGETGNIPLRKDIEVKYPELDRFGHKHLFNHGKFEDFRDEIESPDWLEKARQRNKVIKTYGFAIPCCEAIEELRKYQPLIEVGAGSGYWTWLLNRHNINCIASDPCTDFISVVTHASFDCEFLKLDGAEAVTKYSNHNVLMVWPTYENPWPEKVLKAMQCGQTLLSVTEGSGGCCATHKFFNMLNMGFKEDNYTKLPQWDGIHDGLYTHTRTNTWRRAKA